MNKLLKKSATALAVAASLAGMGNNVYAQTSTPTYALCAGGIISPYTGLTGDGNNSSTGFYPTNGYWMGDMIRWHDGGQGSVSSETSMATIRGAGATLVTLGEDQFTKMEVANGQCTLTDKSNGKVVSQTALIGTLGSSTSGGSDQATPEPVMYDNIEKTSVTLNPGGAPTKLTNVADGAVAAGSKDAVNGGQLNDVKTAVDSAKTDITGLQANVAQNTGDIAGLKNDVAKNTGDIAKNTGDIANLSKTWNIQANGDTASQVQPGDTVQFLNGTNIEITRKGNDITIATSKNLTADSLTINAGGTGINMNGKKITNLGKGTADTDAANFGQLKDVAKSLGGGAGYDDKGNYVQPTFNAGTNPDGTPKTTHTVADALDKLSKADQGSVKYSYVYNEDGTVALNADGTPQYNYAKIVVGVDPKTGVAAAPTSITNVADGAIKAGSKDAVNGGQIYKNQASVADALGGGSKVNPDGTISKPNYDVYGKTYDNVNDALKATQTGGPVAYLDSNGQVTQTPTNHVALQGANGEPVRVSNVADGVAPNDAVNMQQFNSAKAALQEQMDKNRKMASAGIASALALQAQAPQQHPGDFAFTAGVGTYDGQTAIGLAGNYLFANGKVNLSAGVARASGGKTSGRVGVGIAF